jgi:hypothetical protein
MPVLDPSGILSRLTRFFEAVIVSGDRPAERYGVGAGSGAGAMLIESIGPGFTTGFVQRTVPRTLSAAVPALDNVRPNVC